VSQKMSHFWLAITLIHEYILMFFWQKCYQKINTKTLYYSISNNLCFCTIWQNGKTRKLHFSLQCCISALPEFNQHLDFSVFLTHDFLADSLNLIISAFSSGCWSMAQDKRSRERCRSWTVLPAQCTSVLPSGFPISQGNAEALHR